MKYNFRQGIQHAPSTAGHPSFLTYNPGNNTVTISIGVNLVRATAAYGSYNYLIEEREDATDAWGPFVWNAAWGPEPIGNYTLYLYWDINRATGLVSRGFTPRVPAFGLTEPPTPATDQHWFDTNINTMKVWDGTAWRKSIRVFAASFVTGTQTITEEQLGSQVGLTSVGPQVDWPDHGYILFGADMRGVRYNDTNFVTTATQLNTNHGSFASPIRLELLNSTVLADEPIPAFSAVTNSGAGLVSLANGTLPSLRPIGLALVDATPGDPVDIVTHGIVYNDQWTWDVSGGEKDLYCGANGELQQGEVTFTNGAARIGTILGPQTVLVDIDLYAIGGGAPLPPDEPLFIFQVGVPSAAHQHYATMLRSQAETLILTTDPSVPVADPLQPSVVLTSVSNGSPAHTHDLTIHHDYTNHTFIVSNISNNGLDNHVSFVVGDGSGGGGGGGSGDPPCQLFSLASINDAYFDNQINTAWTFEDSWPSAVSYTQPTYVTAALDYFGNTEFTFVTAGTYEIRIQVDSVVTTSMPNGSGDNFIYGLQVNAPFIRNWATQTRHPRDMPQNPIDGNENFSWVDTYVVGGDVGDIMTIGAYVGCYNNSSTPVQFHLTVVMERLGSEPVYG